MTFIDVVGVWPDKYCLKSQLFDQLACLVSPVLGNDSHFGKDGELLDNLFKSLCLFFNSFAHNV